MRARAVLAHLVAIIASSPVCAPAAEELLSETSACAVLTRTNAQRDSLPQSGPAGMGWYAADRRSGRIHEYNVADRETGPLPE